MSRPVRAREFNAERLDSVRFVGEVEQLRGTTVVVTCNLGANGERGEVGGRLGVSAWSLCGSGTG